MDLEVRLYCFFFFFFLQQLNEAERVEPPDFPNVARLTEKEAFGCFLVIPRKLFFSPLSPSLPEACSSIFAIKNKDKSLSLPLSVCMSGWSLVPRVLPF